MSKMRYFSPAAKWSEALPLGNGKLAATVYGGIAEDRISLNDATLWSGYPRDYTNARNKDALSQARKLVFEEKYAKADAFVKKNMHGDYCESYLPLGDLIVTCAGAATAKNYSRTLSLDDAILRVENGGEERDAFVSRPSDALFYRIKFSKPSDVTVKARSKLKARAETFDKNLLFLTGFAPDRVVPNYRVAELYPVRYNEKKGMAFSMLCRVDTDGETVSSDSFLTVRNATVITLTVMTETGFLGFDQLPSRNTSALKSLLTDRMRRCRSDFETEQAAHTADFRSVYGRHTLRLLESGGRSAPPETADAETDAASDVKTLLKRAESGKTDAALVNLLYDYGKYLLVSGSRGSQPLNLQGQWNPSVRPPWSSNLTTNINYQMNYWCASACNLTECLNPFYKTLSEIAESGAKTARINYGFGGFSCNHNVDVWRMTTPVKGNPAYMHAPLCGVWIVNEALAHCVTSGEAPDEATLTALKDAVVFVLESLTERNGKLVTCPSASPEAEFLSGAKRCALGYASAFEIGLILECFRYAKIYLKDIRLLSDIRIASENLYGFTVGKTGLNEWHDDKPLAERGHRHFSPLYALYPAKIISYYGEEKLLEAAKKLFYDRMAHARNSIGWSAAWAMCLAARLHDGEKASALIDNFTSKSLFPNLFSFHPPTYFQIDGNFGFVAAVNEMLFYEEDGIVDLLPACPKAWKYGRVDGHKILGTELGMEWKDGVVVSVWANRPMRINARNLSPNVLARNVTVVERGIRKPTRGTESTAPQRSKR